MFKFINSLPVLVRIPFIVLCIFVVLFIVACIYAIGCFIRSFFCRKSFPKFKCAIYTFFGVPGSGKTTFASAITSQYKKANVPVYSNVPIEGAYKLTRNDIGKYNLPAVNGKACLIVDECGIDFNNRDFKHNFEGEALQWWKRHRHYKCTVFIFSQSYEDMDKKLRDLTQAYYLVMGTFLPWFKKACKIRFKVGINDLTGDIQDMYYFDPFPWCLFSTKYIFAPAYWTKFDSWECPDLPDLPLEMYKFIDPPVKPSFPPVEK